jgi:hypothetical protein
VEGILGFSRKIFFKYLYSYLYLYIFFGWECLHTVAMETRNNSDGDAMVFMALKFLCHFLLFGMSMLLWILLDVD